MVGGKVDGQILFRARSEKPKILCDARGEKWTNLFGAKWQLWKNVFDSQSVKIISLLKIVNDVNRLDAKLFCAKLL